MKALPTYFFLEMKQKIFCHIVKIVEESGRKKAAKFSVHLDKCKLLCQCPFHGSIVGVFSIKFALLARYCLVIVMFSTIALDEASCFLDWNYDWNSNWNFWRIPWPSALISEIFVSIWDVIKIRQNNSWKKKAVGSALQRNPSRNLEQFRSEKQSTSPFVGYHPTEDSKKMSR